MHKITPILKWAGGKRQLIPEIMPLFPKSYHCYYEPFVGAGAIFFAAQPPKAVINDINTELINVYFAIKNMPDELIALLKEYEHNHCKEFYYKIRDIDKYPNKMATLSDTEKAARTIYLNRTCYNGLYRVNKEGHFNTPIGNNSHIQIVNEKGIYAINTYLNQADIQILNVDYSEALEGIEQGDFAFLDPPYFPINKASFLRYDSVPYGIDKQNELKGICDHLTEIGVQFIETNSDCKEIRELYADYHLISVDVRRSINAKPNGRAGKELIICNY